MKGEKDIGWMIRMMVDKTVALMLKIAMHNIGGVVGYQGKKDD